MILIPLLLHTRAHLNTCTYTNTYTHTHNHGVHVGLQPTDV